MNYVHLCFIRPGKFNTLDRVVVVRLGGFFGDQEDALDRLRTAITEWMQSSYAGSQAWKESSEDFNIGDLLGSYITDVSLEGELRRRSIHDIQVVCEFEDMDIIPYDRILPYSDVMEDTEHNGV